MSTVAAAHPVTSPRMRVITDSGRWWRVVGGSVDLRLVPADRRSAHRPLVRVDDGGIVIGVDPTAVPTGWELVAVRGRGATLVERSSVDTPSDPEVAAWLHLLACRLTVAGPTPPPAHDLIVPGARSIRLAEPIVAATPVLAHVRNGEALLYGHGSARLNAGATTLLPEGAWVVPAPTGPADVDVVGLPDRGSRRWRSAIDTFHRVALTAIVAELARRDDDRRQRAAARIDYARDLVEGAASTIVNVLAHRRPTLALGRSGDELALAAVRAVGDHEGFSVTGAPPGHGSTDPTEAVLRASRVPWRDVRLEGFWWKRLGAPLITTVAETGSPVAVLPRARGGALLVDPATDTEAVLDETAAEALTPHAKQVYAPIPRTADTAREVFGFALRGARRDLTLLLLAGLTVGVLGLATPIVTGRLVGGSAGRTSLGSLIVVVVIAAIATGLFATVRNLAAVRLQGRLQARLEPAMWDRLLGLDVSFYARYTVGELVQRTNSIAYIRQSLSDATVNTVLGAFFSAFSLAALVLVDPRLAAATLGVVAVLAATLTMLGRRQQRHDRERFDLFGQVYGMLYPLLVGIDKIQVAGRESHAYAHWSSVYARQWVRDLRSLRYQALAASVSSSARRAGRSSAARR